MIIHYNNNPFDTKQYDTSRLRQEFLTEQLFEKDNITMVYSHIDRAVAMGVCPDSKTLNLSEALDKKVFGTDFFLQRRELGIINLGGEATITVDGNQFSLNNLDALYIGKGREDVTFSSADNSQPARLYCLSAPAHAAYKTRIIRRDEANQIHLGDADSANVRTINQYIHPDILETSQLSMGITHLAPGSVWNTMPAHTHERRMEAYFYFNIDDDQVVFHLMGEPTETRHIVVRNQQLVLSPSWSIHSGCGTKNYSFIWGMLGENLTFDDMDFVDMKQIQ
ncbi:5-dehydro-4-deoxy-D-glucuronate isomerase [Vibrio maritimus]|uniref:5-dehydro-4-deoxy-D-glucuronate isomerase n=1 Tax=Vibrio maritimus TaxID=990268 RepID=UPI0037354F62